MRNLLLNNTSCFFNKTHARISACSLADSASIYPKQCRKLKSNWLTGKLRKDNETKWLTGTEKATMFLFRVSRRMPKIKTSNKGQTTGQKFGFQKQLWKFTAIALNKLSRSWTSATDAEDYDRTGWLVWLAFQKYTRADLSQISLEIMWLAILMKVEDSLPSSQSWPLNPDPSTHKHW